MFLTKECEYGIRIIRALADGSQKTVKTIAAEELIPVKFAHNIVTKLERAEFLKGIRGRSGGVRLRRPLNAFTMVDIITAIDNNRCIGECLSEDSGCVFKSHPERPCTIHNELMWAQNVVMSALGSKTMDRVLYQDEDIRLHA